MPFDAHSNFGVSSVAVAPSPATTGTSLTVATGEGTRFPAAPFNATLAPSGVLATPANAEIVRVTARSGDVLTMTRAQEGSVARAVVVGDLCVASITAKALQDIETTPYARTDLVNTFTSSQRLELSFPQWQFYDTSAPANSRRFRMFNANQELSIDTLDDAASVVQAQPLRLTRAGDGKISRDLYEKQRTTALGHWIDVPFNAANFTADAGTWTVSAGNVLCQQYALVGKTLFLSIRIEGSMLSATPGNLSIALPIGVTFANSFLGAATVWNGGSYQPGLTYGSAAGSVLYVNRTSGNYSTGQVNVGVNIAVSMS